MLVFILIVGCTRGFSATDFKLDIGKLKGNGFICTNTTALLDIYNPKIKYDTAELDSLLIKDCGTIFPSDVNVLWEHRQCTVAYCVNVVAIQLGYIAPNSNGIFLAREVYFINGDNLE